MPKTCLIWPRCSIRKKKSISMLNSLWFYPYLSFEDANFGKSLFLLNSKDIIPLAVLYHTNYCVLYKMKWSILIWIDWILQIFAENMPIFAIPKYMPFYFILLNLFSTRVTPLDMSTDLQGGHLLFVKHCGIGHLKN